MKKIFSMALAILTNLSIQSQTLTQNERLYSHKFTILAGLIQPLALQGGNVEVNYTTKRMIFDYSHGFNLNLPSVGDFKTQQVELNLPVSTGFGVGYRFTSFLDLRVEPKLHSFEVFYKNERTSGGSSIKTYKTFTLGLGLYYRFFPFKQSENKFLQGLTTSASIRWWQNIGSTLSNDRFSYANKLTGKTETLKASNIGISNSPLVMNLAIGYTFGGK